MRASTPLARYLACLIAPAIGQDPGTGPLDLNSLARRFGAQDVLYRAALMSGFTDWSGEEPIVQVGLSRSDGRRRATLAHECGHLLLDPILHTPPFQNAPENRTEAHRRRIKGLLGADIKAIRRALLAVDIETLCDLVAIELMLPASALEHLRAQVKDLPSLIATASNWRVSLSMLTNRLSDAGEDFALLRMVSTRNNSWVCASAAGLRERRRGFIEWIDVPSDVGTRKQTKHLSIKLAYGGAVQNVAAETFSVGDHAMIFLRSLPPASTSGITGRAPQASRPASECRRKTQTADS